jgi:hypothetical protein
VLGVSLSNHFLMGRKIMRPRPELFKTAIDDRLRDNVCRERHPIPSSLFVPTFSIASAYHGGRKTQISPSQPVVLAP